MLKDVSSKPIRDTVDDFVEGLKHFDKEGNGLISAVELRHLLTGLGEKMSEDEVEMLIHGKEDSQVMLQEGKTLNHYSLTLLLKLEGNKSNMV